MKETKLTKELLSKIKPEEVIYAEYAGMGARGDEGTARIYALQDGKMHFYLVRMGDSSEGLMDETVQFLNEAAENGVLISEDAGFGNQVLKKKEAEFLASDSERAFIYENGGKKYTLKASVPGVYAAVMTKFAKRKMTSERVRAFMLEWMQDMDLVDRILFEKYEEQLERLEEGLIWFNFTPYDYFNAVDYIRNMHGLAIITDTEQWQDGLSALTKYRLAYAVGILGWDDIHELFDQMIEQEELNAFERISEALGTDLDDVFAKVERVGASEVFAPMKEEFESEAAAMHYDGPETILMMLRRMFFQPVLIEFDEEERKQIIEALTYVTPKQILRNGTGLAKFVVNFMMHEDEWSYKEILTMVAGIIRVMPSYGLEGSDADQVFWICNEVLERCWGDISEDEETQKRFRNLIYFLHWRRVGSVWPIVHTGEFELQDKVANDILNESINYVLSLKDIAERNKELGELLEREAKGSREDIGYGIIGENKLGYPSDKNGLWRRALEYRLSKMGAKSKFETILKEVDRENWFCYLNYPETVEEADLVLGELVKTGAKSKFKGYPRFMTLMSLIQTPNTIGVGEHILKFVAENLEKMAKAIIKECPEMEFDSETLATTVFRGAAKGVTEKNELEPLAEIRKVAKKLGSKEADLKLTEKYAKWHQKAIAFQRKTVTPVIEG